MTGLFVENLVTVACISEVAIKNYYSLVKIENAHKTVKILGLIFFQNFDIHWPKLEPVFTKIAVFAFS